MILNHSKCFQVSSYSRLIPVAQPGVAQAGWWEGEPVMFTNTSQINFTSVRRSTVFNSVHADTHGCTWGCWLSSALLLLFVLSPGLFLWFLSLLFSPELPVKLLLLLLASFVAPSWFSNEVNLCSLPWLQTDFYLLDVCCWGLRPGFKHYCHHRFPLAWTQQLLNPFHPILNRHPTLNNLCRWWSFC